MKQKIMEKIKFAVIYNVKIGPKPQDLASVDFGANIEYNDFNTLSE